MAQQAWKPIITARLTPQRAVEWAMSVDTQRIVRDSSGTYSVFLRWNPGADSVNAARTDRVEQRRLDCSARLAKQLAGQIVQVRNGKDADVTVFPVTDVSWGAFEADGMHGEFFDSVCLWIRRTMVR